MMYDEIYWWMMYDEISRTGYIFSDMKFSFELHVRDHPNIILGAKTYEEKCNWMAALISLLRRR